MKKNTLRTIVNYIKNVPELAAEYAELAAEIQKDEDKARANRALYDAAKGVVIDNLPTDKGITASELFEACEDDLPEGFTKSKMQYALSNYWTAEVEKIKVGKDVCLYKKA